MKISTMVVGLILCSLAVILVGGLLTQYNAQDNYGRSDFDNKTLEKMNKLDDLSDFSKEMRDNTSIKTDSGLFDILGAYFASGYKSARVAAGSVDTLESMGEAASEELGKQIPYMEYIKVALITILVIVVFIGIIVAALIKWRV